MSSVVISGDSSGTITLQAPAVSGSTTINLPATSGTATVMPTGYTLGAGNTSSFKNRIINGAMVIDQRNAGASGTAVNVYTIDRWKYQASQASKGTWQQNAGSVTPPAGFTNYLGFTSSSAYSITSTDEFTFNQYIEGFNIADLGWGTANAKTITLSFWVRSSLTGTFGGALKNINADRGYPFSYIISSANTWEQKSITITGDTTGTWNSTNSSGIQLDFGLGMGSSYSGTAGSWQAGYFGSATGATSVVGTSGATFYITGVQLEVGSTATSFDYRDYGRELILCQRYYQQGIASQGWGQSFSTSSAVFGIPFTVVMRTSPTTGYTGSSWNVDVIGGSQNTTNWYVNSTSTNRVGIVLGSLSLSNFQPVGLNGTNITLSAEL